MDLMIRQWLNERQSLLIAYNNLCQTVAKNGSVSNQQMQAFCQLLIDYLSVGHFKIFEKLAEAQANTAEPELDKDILAKILRSTLST